MKKIICDLDLTESKQTCSNPATIYHDFPGGGRVYASCDEHIGWLVNEEEISLEKYVTLKKEYMVNRIIQS